MTHLMNSAEIRNQTEIRGAVLTAIRSMILTNNKLFCFYRQPITAAYFVANVFQK